MLSKKRKKKNMFILGIALIVVAVALFIFWRVVFSRPNDDLPRGTVTIGDATFSAELATTMAEQTRGLSYREGLGADDGMLFLFNSSTIQNFWMKDMHFPLDMIWIARDPSAPSLSSGGPWTGKVIGFAQNAPAPDAQLWELPIYSSPDGVDTVLEVVAGTVAKDNIQIGETVEISKSH